jgi:hypothetical protein
VVPPPLPPPVPPVVVPAGAESETQGFRRRTRVTASWIRRVQQLIHRSVKRTTTAVRSRGCKQKRRRKWGHGAPGQHGDLTTTRSKPAFIKRGSRGRRRFTDVLTPAFAFQQPPGTPQPSTQPSTHCRRRHRRRRLHGSEAIKHRGGAQMRVANHASTALSKATGSRGGAQTTLARNYVLPR